MLSIVLGKTLESPLDSKEIKPVNPKGSQSWIFIGRTDAVAEVPILWPPDVKSWLIRKDPDAAKDRRKEEKGKKRWDGWMASPTQWTWIWASSGRWWRTGKPRVLQSKGSWRVRHDLMIEQQQFFPTLYFITGTSSGYSSSLYMVNVCWWCSFKHLICKNYLVTLPTVISMIFVSFFFNWKSFHELFEYLSYWGFPGGSSS